MNAAKDDTGNALSIKDGDTDGYFQGAGPNVCVDGSMKILKMCMGNKIKKKKKRCKFYYFILGYHFNRMLTFKLFCNIIKNYLKFYLCPMTENIKSGLANHF